MGKQDQLFLSKQWFGFMIFIIFYFMHLFIILCIYFIY